MHIVCISLGKKHRSMPFGSDEPMDVDYGFGYRTVVVSMYAEFVAR